MPITGRGRMKIIDLCAARQEKSMSIYLIDYENVHESGLSGVVDLPDGDRVIVFYGDKIKSISFDVHVQMMNSKAVVEFIETHKTAKNYLDFQLSTYLGFLIGRGSNEDLVIVSHDTGFDSVVDFWKERGKNICRRENISEIRPAVQEPVHEKQEKTENKKPSGSARQKKNTAQKAKNPAENTQKTKNPAENTQKTRNPAENTQKAKSPAETEQKPKAAPRPLQPAVDLAAEAGEPVKAEQEAAEESTVKEKKPETQKKPDLPEAYRKKVRAALRSDKLSSGNYTTIYRAISGSKDKLSLNNTLVKAYGSEKGGEVYNRIRDIFAEYQASLAAQR